MGLLVKLLARIGFAGRRKTSAENFRKDKIEIGKLGEKLAGRYLTRKGHEIIEQNYRTRFAEIDLITRFRDTLIFVEVRTKTGDRFGTPEDSLDKRKINKVVNNARMYMKYKRFDGKCRIDAVCVSLGENRRLLRVKHYENITMH